MPPKRVFTDEQCAEIAKKHQEGMSIRKIAAEYDAAFGTIYRAVCRAEGKSIPSGGNIPTSGPLFQISDVIRKEYEEPTSIAMIALRYNSSVETIRCVILHAGGTIRSPGRHLRFLKE